MRPLSSPDATNYPLTLVVNPDAELRLKLIYRRDRFDDATMAILLQQLCMLLKRSGQAAGDRLSDVMGALPENIRGIARRRQRAALATPAAAAAPASEMERKVADVWKDLFQVDDISFEVGYEDPSFFRRIFKRRTGLTPGQYRRMFKPVLVPAPRAAGER